ncbi:hypothetical protein [Kitasatospora sp. NPDC050463]|uniref:hypothetical protein n=1 Tax=Kitasatospora sp. NPDC050463 TaxID=3155786 RepID=UPI0033C48B12
MDWWTLAFAAVAAAAALAAARWGWLDRPQHGWNIRRTREPELDERTEGTEGSETYRKQKTTFAVRAVGTAVAHNVEVRVAGALTYKSKAGSRMYQPSMGAGSRPIVFDVWLSDTTDSKLYIEILWTQLRPYRQLGERIEAESLAWEKWRWNWNCICLRRRSGGGWWTARPVRTSGRWVPTRRRARAEIPVTTEASA